MPIKDDDRPIIPDAEGQALMFEQCPNCREPFPGECACFRNKRVDCGRPVGNITFTACDECWNRRYRQ